MESFFPYYVVSSYNLDFDVYVKSLSQFLGDPLQVGVLKTQGCSNCLLTCVLTNILNP